MIFIGGPQIFARFLLRGMERSTMDYEDSVEGFNDSEFTSRDPNFAGVRQLVLEARR